jgi:hypothetical protein
MGTDTRERLGEGLQFGTPPQQDRILLEGGIFYHQTIDELPMLGTPCVFGDEPALHRFVEFDVLRIRLVMLDTIQLTGFGQDPGLVTDDCFDPLDPKSLEERV